MDTNAKGATTPARAFAALSDGTRRRAFELLAERPMPVGELAAQLPVSRPAVSQHLKVLKEAGLVKEVRDGTRHVYSVKGQGVEELRNYVESIWSVALERLAAAAEVSAGKDSKQQGRRRGRRST